MLVIDKPAGLTSHDVVHVVRRALGRLRVGHTGTLDPFATGVLPLVVGKATRLAQFFASADKEYAARIRLGWSTDTYDGTGEPTSAPVRPEDLPARETIGAALAAFAGTHDQVPPSFSAKKSGGTPAYEMARRGQTVQIPAASVTAHALDLMSVDGEWVDVRVHCSAGYYVRSLAHDLGRALGVGAHLAELRRTRSGAFDLSQSVALEPILRDPMVGLERLVPLERLLPQMPAVVVTGEGVEWIRHGRALGPGQIAGNPAAAGSGEDRVRLMGPDGQLLAVATRRADGSLHPGLVLV